MGGLDVSVEVAAAPEPEPEQPAAERAPAAAAAGPLLPSGPFRAAELFGGAMGSHICSRFADVSTFRQVPDAQEVFVDTASEGSLTLELLERQDASTDAEAMELLWRDAAEQNGVDPTDAASLVLRGSGAFAGGGGGRAHKMGAHVAAVQQARGWMRAVDHGAPPAADGADEAGETQAEDEGVIVSMILLRLATFETDLLVTFNLPGPRPPAESSAEAPAAGQTVAVRSHHDILSAYYATRDPSKTSEQIATILAKRNDGGPFWWPKLCDAVAKKYNGEGAALKIGICDSFYGSLCAICDSFWAHSSLNLGPFLNQLPVGLRTVTHL